MIPYILIILLILILLGIIALVIAFKNKKKHKPDYYAMFIMGIIWLGFGLAIGIPNKNYALFAMGLIFTIVGLVHKNKWKENHKSLKDLSPKERKFRMILIGILYTK